MKDIGKNLLWASFWLFFSIVVIVITGATFFYNVSVDRNISKAIDSGVDPIKAMCSYRVDRVICAPEALK